VEQVFMLISV